MGTSSSWEEVLMKVLLLLPDLLDSIGGIQTFNRCFVKALDELSEKHNLEINILVLTDNGKNKSLLSKYIKLKNVTYKYFNYNRITFALIALIDSFDSDLVIFGHVNFSSLALLMEKKVKKFLIVYGIDVWGKLSFFKLLGIKSIHKILSISSFTEKQMIKYNNLNESAFSRLYCCLNPEYEVHANKSTLNSLGLPKGKIILCVSRMNIADKYKGVDLLIKSMPQVLKEEKDSFLVLVGRGDAVQNLKLLAKELGVLDRVIFKTSVQDLELPAYYKSCDIFAMPSIQEGFGIVYLEAMYFSKPNIAINIGAIPEVVSNGQSGILLESQDLNELSSSIVKLLSDRKYSETLGITGKRILEEKFTFSKFVNNIDLLLTEVKSK